MKSSGNNYVFTYTPAFNAENTKNAAARADMAAVTPMQQ
jgi:hypothetical protein